MPPVHPPSTITLPQARIMQALSITGWITRAGLAEKAGFSPNTGVMHDALFGKKAEQHRGKPYKGLIERELVLEWEDGSQGEWEIVYDLSEKGRMALEAYLKEKGPLPPVKPAEQATNLRYGFRVARLPDRPYDLSQPRRLRFRPKAED